MGIFTRASKAEFGSAPTIKAAAGAASQIDNFYTYSGSWAREEAIMIPTISRARDLIVSLVSGLPFNQYGLVWNQQMGEYEELQIPSETWMERPDPEVTRQFLLSWTVDDLIMHGRAMWWVQERSAIDGRPVKFKWLPMSDVTTLDMAGPIWWGKSKQIRFNGFDVPYQDVIQFLSPIQGILSMGARAIEISRRLDNAAMRFASNEITAGYIQQTPNSEPMSGEELTELAAAWSNARKRNAIGALNANAEWKEFQSDPSKLQLVEARTHQMAELANLANIPQIFVGAPAGTGMTYQNQTEMRTLLYQAAAKPYIDCINQTLSGNDVLARGRFVRLDVSEFITEAIDESTVQQPNLEDMSS